MSFDLCAVDIVLAIEHFERLVGFHILVDPAHDLLTALAVSGTKRGGRTSRCNVLGAQLPWVNKGAQPWFLVDL
jgi:hypothetical protein